MTHRYTFPEDRFLLLGTVVKAQGLRGEISVHALSGQPESLGRYTAFTLVDNGGELSPPLTVQSFRAHKGKAVVGFDQVRDRTMAERLVGMGVLLDRNDLPETAADEFYWHELQGLPVRTSDGRQLGRMLGQFFNGAHEVMVIGDTTREYLVPVIPGIIVSHSATELVIAPPPGLLAINQETEIDGE